ncbi:MAG TPA: pyridoxal-dependent decarboxylase [Bdellovibrionota bacterium]|jgi:L-2,4-diaminobutyrate decarboxylase|nr:pyridoxal-dependent decarboxylase [Bdellovibrionota bacterium]
MARDPGFMGAPHRPFEWLGPALAELERFSAQSDAGDGPVLRAPDIQEIRRFLGVEHGPPREPATPERLGDFLHKYLHHATRLRHPGYAAHQVAVTHPAAAVADLVNGLTNNGSAVYEMAPAGVALERAAIGWMLGCLGWNPSGDGILTHGGSVANLTALLAARAKKVPDAWSKGAPSDVAVLAPETAHYSVARAVAIMGLGADAVIPLETDGLGVVIPEKLDAGFDRARKQGRRPIALVAGACHTATGLYDPLTPMAEFCERRDLWFHVDGAHGASALASPRFKVRLDGAERADSLIWDAHKMLAVSSLCAAVLYRDQRSRDGAFAQEASYLRAGAAGADARPDLFPYTLECTRGALGLKLWLVLEALGTQGIARHVETLYDRATEFAALLRSRPGFKVPYEPQSNILCFEIPRGADPHAIQKRLAHEGDFYVTSATVKKKPYLRVSLMNPATDLKVLERFVQRVEEFS